MINLDGSSLKIEWGRVLKSEVARWTALSSDQLIDELQECICYEVEYDGKQYQVEVEIVENTKTYILAVVAVDDGSLPASMRPVCESFICNRPEAATIAI